MNGRRLLMSAVLGAVALGVGYVWGPHEYKQWQIALAREATLNGQRELVLERYESLTQRYPEDHKLQLEYLAALLEDGQTATAIERWEPMLERSDLEWDERMQLASILADGLEFESAYQQMQLAYTGFRAELAKQQGESEESVRLNSYQRLSWMNNLAYYAYLANQDLVVRWRSMVEVLASQGVDDQMTLYRARALRAVGRPKEARDILSQGISIAEERLESQQADLRRGVQQWVGETEWPPVTEPPELQQRQSNIIEMRQMLRVLYEEAAAVCRTLEDDQGRRSYNNAAARISILGDAPSFDLSPQAVARRLQELATYVDTRGALATELGLFASAQQDLDQAIQATYLAFALTQDVGLDNSPAVVDVRRIRQQQKATERALAVYHYHRAILAEVQSDEVSAAIDYDIVRRLGWQPGLDLH